MTRNSYFSLLGILAFVGYLAIGCNNQEPAETEAAEDTEVTNQNKKADQELQAQAKGLFGKLPEPADINRPVAQLGKKLFYETSLSISNQMSCNTCHKLSEYGVDHEKTSLGHDKKTRGERNSPTVYNAYTHIAQFWDGRAEDLIEQAKGPVLNPVEMGMPTEAKVLENLNQSEEYKKLFAEAFPDQKSPVSFHNMAVAMAEFEKTLSTPGDFDKYMEGDVSALTEEERKGMETFIKVGCTTCHIGPALGGKMFQKFGLIKGPYWEYTGSEHIDSGRVAVTGQASDRFVFKVPSLRNIAETGPYFHDGSVEDLTEAIRIMGTTQLGRELSDEQVSEIETFLESLTGEIPDYALQDEDPGVAAL